MEEDSANPSVSYQLIVLVKIHKSRQPTAQAAYLSGGMCAGGHAGDILTENLAMLYMLKFRVKLDLKVMD